MNKSFRSGLSIPVLFKILQKTETTPTVQPERRESKKRLRHYWKKVINPVHRFYRHLFPRWDKVFRTDFQNIFSQYEDLRQTLARQEQTLAALRPVLNHLTADLARVEKYSYVNARRYSIPCGDITWVRTEWGYVAVPPHDYALIIHLVEASHLEEGTERLIGRFLHPGECFVDVGANVGLMTLAAAHALAGQGRIFCFEPFPETCSFLRKTLALNGFFSLAEVIAPSSSLSEKRSSDEPWAVNVRCAACSSHNGDMSLHLGATCGHHSLYALDASTDIHQHVTVKVTTLDESIPPEQAVHLLKIDAEGAELDIIQGGSRVLNDNPDIALIVEFGISHLKRTNHSTKDFLDAFARCGFQWRAINPTTGALEAWPLEQWETVDSVNLFFAREHSSAWERIDHVS